MSEHSRDRRAFLKTALAASVVWAGVDLTDVEDALGWAVERRTEPGGAYLALTPEQLADVEAMTARIIPSAPGSPGAREAGAVHFIDKALDTFNAGQKELHTDGIDDLNRRAAEKVSGARFAALSPDQQDAVLRDIENTAFFQTVRFETIVGTFALPSWGGNRDYIGWAMIGVTHEPLYRPPFGYYDAQTAGGG